VWVLRYVDKRHFRRQWIFNISKTENGMKYTKQNNLFFPNCPYFNNQFEYQESPRVQPRKHERQIRKSSVFKMWTHHMHASNFYLTFRLVSSRRWAFVFTFHVVETFFWTLFFIINFTNYRRSCCVIRVRFRFCRNSAIVGFFS